MDATETVRVKGQRVIDELRVEALMLYDPKNRLRAYYIRQLKKDGWNGDLGGWVRHERRNVALHGWAEVLMLLRDSMTRFARALATRSAETAPTVPPAKETQP